MRLVKKSIKVFAKLFAKSLNALFVVSSIVFLISERMNGGRDTTATADEVDGAFAMDGHNGRVAEETAELDGFTDVLTDDGDNTDGSGLVVDDTDGDFVGNDARDGLRLNITWDSNHIETDGTNGGHCLELLEGEGAFSYGINHTAVLGDGDEGAGKTSNVA